MIVKILELVIKIGIPIFGKVLDYYGMREAFQESYEANVKKSQTENVIVVTAKDESEADKRLEAP